MIIREPYLDKLKKYTGKHLIKVISGMRRTGKSTLLKQYHDFLTGSGIPKKNILLINMELLDFDFINDYSDLSKYIHQNLSKESGTKYLLLDEVQEIDQWEKAVNSFLAKGSYDITITGSNARMLSTELSTLLTGRYIEIPLYPFSFKEFKSVRLRNHPNEAITTCFKHYLRYGGLPAIHVFPFNDDEIFPYLNAMGNSALLKDVITRNKIRNAEQLERITRFVFSNCGNITSAKNIADYLKSQRTKVSVETVQNYLLYLAQAFMVHKVRRFDLKGKKLLEYSEKYYPADVGLRFGLTGYSDSDISGLLESVVYVELLRRGFTVFVGQTGSYEIDFVAQKQEERLYIQVAYLLGNDKTVEREFGNLERINDSFPKMVLSLDEVWPQQRNGIIRKNIIDFLLDQ